MIVKFRDERIKSIGKRKRLFNFLPEFAYFTNCFSFGAGGGGGGVSIMF